MTTSRAGWGRVAGNVGGRRLFLCVSARRGVNPFGARLDGGLEGSDRVEVPLDEGLEGSDRVVVLLVELGGGLTGVLFDWSYSGGVRPLSLCVEPNLRGVRPGQCSIRRTSGSVRLGGPPLGRCWQRLSPAEATRAELLGPVLSPGAWREPRLDLRGPHQRRLPAGRELPDPPGVKDNGPGHFHCRFSSVIRSSTVQVAQRQAPLGRDPVAGGAAWPRVPGAELECVKE